MPMPSWATLGDGARWWWSRQQRQIADNLNACTALLNSCKREVDDQRWAYAVQRIVWGLAAASVISLWAWHALQRHDDGMLQSADRITISSEPGVGGVGSFGRTRKTVCDQTTQTPHRKRRRSVGDQTTQASVTQTTQETQTRRTEPSDRLSCPICYTEFGEGDAETRCRPMASTCGHVLCEDCVGRLQTDRGSLFVECPSCKNNYVGMVSQTWRRLYMR